MRGIQTAYGLHRGGGGHERLGQTLPAIHTVKRADRGFHRETVLPDRLDPAEPADQTAQHGDTIVPRAIEHRLRYRGQGDRTCLDAEAIIRLPLSRAGRRFRSTFPTA